MTQTLAHYIGSPEGNRRYRIAQGDETLGEVEQRPEGWVILEGAPGEAYKSLYAASVALHAREPKTHEAEKVVLAIVDRLRREAEWLGGDEARDFCGASTMRWAVMIVENEFLANADRA